MKLYVVGAGGHAKVVADTLLAMGLFPDAALERDGTLVGTTLLGVPVLDEAATLAAADPATTRLANGIGSVSSTTLRRAVYERLKRAGFSFVTLRHPSATVGREVTLGEGAEVMAGAILQPGTIIGENALVNTGARIDHDCRIGAHAHIAPGAVLSGNMTIGEGSHIGTGSAIIQGIVVGAGCVVGAGAAVVRNVSDGTTVFGVPAKESR